MTVGGVEDKEEYFRMTSISHLEKLANRKPHEVKKQEVLSPEQPQAQISTCWVENSSAERS